MPPTEDPTERDVPVTWVSSGYQDSLPDATEAGDTGPDDLLVGRATWDHIWDVLGQMGAERDSYRDRRASLIGVLRQMAAGTVSDPRAWAKQIVDGIDAPPPGEPDEGEGER